MSDATIGTIGTIIGALLLAVCVVALIAEAWWLTRPATPRAHARTRKIK